VVQRSSMAEQQRGTQAVKVKRPEANALDSLLHALGLASGRGGAAGTRASLPTTLPACFSAARRWAWPRCSR
jgi:hypothetical protein